MCYYGMNSSVATADGAITTRSGVLHGVVLAGSATGSVALYDGTSTGGRKVFHGLMQVVGGAGYSSETNLNIAFSSGLYLDLTGIQFVTVIWG